MIVVNLDLKIISLPCLIVQIIFFIAKNVSFKLGICEIVFAEFAELIESPKKSKAFQLLMYAYLYLKMHPDYIGLNIITGNFSFKNLKPGLLKVRKKINNTQSEVVKITQAVLDNFEAQLEIVLKKINNNDFVQTKELKNCEWCDYKSICKR